MRSFYLASFFTSLFIFTHPAWATAGFAEWQIETPGGFLISHADGWKEDFGDCLRDPAEADHKVIVERLARWRYWSDHVAGQAQKGYFLFNEKTRKLDWFDSESELSQVIEGLGLTSTSEWMSGGDGWAEAWMPFMIWPYCKVKLRGPSNDREAEIAKSNLYDETYCRRQLSRQNMSRYARTAWGKECKRHKAEPGRAAPEVRESFEGFCQELEKAGK